MRAFIWHMSISCDNILLLVSRYFFFTLAMFGIGSYKGICVSSFVCRRKPTLSKEINTLIIKTHCPSHLIRITENIFYFPIYQFNHTCIRIDHDVLWLYTYEEHFLQRNDSSWSIKGPSVHIKALTVWRKKVTAMFKVMYAAALPSSFCMIDWSL